MKTERITGEELAPGGRKRPKEECPHEWTHVLTADWNSYLEFVDRCDKCHGTRKRVERCRRLY